MKKFEKLFSQFIKFLFVSGIGWLIDFCLYAILTIEFNLKVFYANIFSSIPAISYVFLISTKKIFIKSHRNNLTIIQKYIIYFIYQLLLIFFISIVAENLYILAGKYNLNFKIMKVIIKILITPVTMTINFFVIKYLAEKL
ncbi:GtrA family protein [Fusobacterium polymorphum]|uniref:GtrA family protein n=1 Tax=Fusobacterium nucleatum subsp. polymorphum TaxID=76857 RepID=UPI00300A27A6